MKKKISAEIVLGYCPNNIVKRKFWYCKARFVLQPRWLVQGEICIAEVQVYCNTVECRGSELYCNIVYWAAVYRNTLDCIVAVMAVGGQSVSQYKIVL